jgi:O-antigen/teichoic acid export membrane protein
MRLKRLVNLDIKNFDFLNNRLLKNILIVASGTGGAQFLAFLFVPIITRLYGPVQYGELGSFLSLVNIVLPIVTLGYAAAIILPKSERQAKGLLQLSLLIGICFAAVIYCITFLITHNYPNMASEYSFIYNYSFFLPCFVFFSAFHEVGQAFLQRLKKFKNIAICTLSHAFINYGGQALIGFFYPLSLTLILIHIFSIAMKSLLLVKISNVKVISGYNWKIIKFVAIKYKDFPLYRAPQLLINALSQSLPVLILTYFFSSAIVGYYTLARFTLAIPVSLLGRSVISVFYPHFNELFLQKKPVCRLLIKATFNLAVIGIIPFSIIIFFGPQLFVFVFGSEWNSAGVYASYLSIWLYFALVNLPCVSIIPVIKAQQWYLKYELLSLVLRAFAMLVTINYVKEPLVSVLVFSVVGVAVNCYLIFKVHNKAKTFDKNLQ